MRFTTNLKLSLVGLVIAAASFVGINAILSDADATSRDDCTANAVIKCGVDSVADMRDAYNTNRTKDIKGIYGHSFFGLSSDVVNNYTVKTGSVKRNGNVYVGDKLVATGAYSAGRDYYSGSTKRTTANGTTFYTRSVGTWQQASWDVYVFLDKSGRFVGAVMKSCGNPVTGKPTQPKPVYKCVSLSRINKDRTTWTFRGKAQEKHGASLAGFTFNYGDGTSKYVKYTGHDSDDGSYKYVDSTKSYTKAGTYTVKITAHFTVNGTTKKVTSADCQKPVTVEPKPQPKMVEVCDLDDMTVKEVTEDEYNGNRERYTTDLSKCEKPAPVAECVSLSATRIGEMRFRFDARANVENGATISGYTFTVRNTPSSLPSTDPIYLNQTISTTTESASLEHTFTNLRHDTTYRVSVTVNTSEGAKTSDACKTTFKTEPEKTIVVCRLEDKVYPVTIKESEFDSSKYSKNPDDCKEDEPVMIDVCRLADMTYPVSIREEDFDPELHSKDPADCVEPEMVEVCDLTDDTVKQVTRDELNANPERYTEDLTQCDDVQVCDPETGEIITVKKSDEDDYAPVESDECKVNVCDPDTGEIITVAREDEDKYLPVDAADCQEQPEETNVTVCDPETGDIITVKESEASEYADKDSDECADEPEVKGEVTELPQTGIAQTLSGLFGLGAMTTAWYYYRAGRN